MQINDEVFEVGNYGVYGKFTITKVTPTTATLSDGRKIKKETGRFIGIDAYMNNGLSHIEPYTEKLNDEWFNKLSQKALREFSFFGLDNAELKDVFNAIKNKYTIIFGEKEAILKEL